MNQKEYPFAKKMLLVESLIRVVNEESCVSLKSKLEIAFAAGMILDEWVTAAALAINGEPQEHNNE